MRTLVITRGFPASGKSTWARDQLAREPQRWRRINRDDLRAMANPPIWSRDSEDFIIKVQNEAIRQALADGYDVIVDNCHVSAQSIKMLYKIAEEIGDVTVREKAFNTSAKECLIRNAKREGTARVPDKVITEMSHKARRGFSDKETYFSPKGMVGESIVQDKSLPKAIICDLDGTLAIIGDRNKYDASKCDIVDKPNDPVIACVQAMHVKGHKIIFMSGREEKDRAPSERFIEKYCTRQNKENFFKNGKQIFVNEPIQYQLHMRATGDKRKDNIVKRELFDAHVAGRYYVEFVLDDRDSVCHFWRSVGLTCFQVNYGNF